MDLAPTPSRKNAMRNIVTTLARLLDHGWIPLGELGYLLDVSQDTIYKRKRDNLPPTIRVGGAERIYHDDLIAYLRKYPRKHVKTVYVDAVLALYKTMKIQRAESEDQLSFDDTHYNQQKYQAILDDPDLTEEERQWLKHTYF